MRLLEGIEAWLRAGVPAAGVDGETARKVLIVRVATLALLILGAPFIVQYWRLGVPHMSLAVMAAMTLGGANLIMLRRVEWAGACGHLATATLFLLLMVSNLSSGGFYDPNLAWLYVIPLCSFLLTDLRGGWVWTGVTVAAVAGFWLLPEWGIQIPDAVPPEQHAAQSLANRLSAVFAVGLLANGFVYVQRITEQNLRRANEEAETASLAKSAFLASMSHEIRTPMTAILGYADVLDDEFELSTDQRRAVRTIRRNGEHLLQIINDILDLSKIESGRLDVERTRFSPVQALQDVEALMRVRADAKGLDFSVTYEGAMPETILGDPLRVQQVLFNLIGNAIKFTEVGSVRVRVRQVPGESGLGLEICVVDSGVGLVAEDRDRLFSAFAQAEASTTRRFGGSGLGLAICARLCELMRGSVDVESELGAGSTFRFMLWDVQAEGSIAPEELGPQCDPEGPERDSLHSTRPYDGFRFLLAEDGPDNQRLIGHLLRRLGATVAVAENGRVAVDQALAAADEGMAFDLILMDMQMPELDGYEATRELRHAGYLRPIVALTAHAMAHERQGCLDAGCDDFATKPIDRPRLFAAIDRLIAPAKPPSH
jgi:signal transduction histidine kinase/ActR/RegA family two-component response regulator